MVWGPKSLNTNPDTQSLKKDARQSSKVRRQAAKPEALIFESPNHLGLKHCLRLWMRANPKVLLLLALLKHFGTHQALLLNMLWSSFAGPLFQNRGFAS